MEERFDWRLVSHDNLCTHCVYKWPESVGFSCSVLRGKRCRTFVTRCGQYEPDADEELRLRELAERGQ